MATIFKRSKVWYSKITINGKEVRKPLSTDKAVALKMLADLKTDIKSDKYGLNKPDWQSFKEKYLLWAQANKKEKTIARDKLALEYLEEFHEIDKLTQLTPSLLDDFKTYLKNKSDDYLAKKKTKTLKEPYKRGRMSAHGINRNIQSIKAIIRKAESWGLVSVQKWSSVSKYKVAKGRVEFYTPQEVSLLLKTAKDLADKTKKYSPWETIILLGARAGLRRGEMQNLTWADIDFDRELLSITPKEDWAPKDFECRDIPLSTDLAQHLKTIPRHGKYVLYDSYGERFSIDSITTYFRDKISRKAGLSGNVHKLRHTFASHLVQNGVDLYVAKELLGHNNITTTEIYAHLRPLDHKQAISKLPKV